MNTITRLAGLAALAPLVSLTIAIGADEGTGKIIQQAYIKASNSGWNDQFGWSGIDLRPSGGVVALDGDTLVVGAPWEDSSAKGVDGDQGDGLAPPSFSRINGYNSGAAYVFWRYGNGWTQQAYLKSSDTAPGDNFGEAVAVSGDTLVVGAPGADGKEDGVPYFGTAYVFVRKENTWQQQARLNVPGNTEYGRFGVSVAISGDTVVVGAMYEKSAPAIEGGKAGDLEQQRAGAAYVFVRDGGEWSRQARLVASQPSYEKNFGTSVAISGDTLIVGASGDSSAAGGVNGDETDNSLYKAGAAYVFVRDETKWSQQAYLKSPKPQESDQFGTSVAISGDTAVVGALNARAGSVKPGKDGADRGDKDDGSGAAFVFVRDGDTWSGQASLTPPEFEGGEKFGCSVAISGDRLLVGAKRAPDRTDKRRGSPGAAYAFTRKATTWDHGTPIMASNAGDDDQFGGAVAISGGTVAVGAPGEDGFARGVNGNQDDKFDDNHDSGAAYVFVIPGADNGEKAPAGVGEGKGPLEERLFGYWATDWDAMAESWQPAVKGWAEMMSAGKDMADAEKKVVQELKDGYGMMTVEIKKGEIILNQDPGRPSRMTYVPAVLDPATGTFELKTSGPEGTAEGWRAVLDGDRLTLMESGDEASPLPLLLNRIDEATFKARQKAAEAYSKARKAEIQGSGEAVEEKSAESTKGRE